MKTSSQGRKFIEGFEGLILQAYDDHNDHIVPVGGTPIGVLTIGYGHTDAAGPPKVYVGQKITQAEADKFLATDLSAVENEVNHLVKVPLTQNQFDALVSFQFNTGALDHSGNSLLAALNSKDYAKTADDFLLYDHAAGVKLAGLTRRREQERKMFLSPDTSNINAGPNATTVVVAAGTAGAVAATQTSPDHFWIVIAGILIVGSLIGLIVHWFKNRKVTNVVIPVPPMVGPKGSMGQV